METIDELVELDELDSCLGKFNLILGVAFF